MFELLTLAFLQFITLTGQPTTLNGGGTGWGEDFTKTPSATSSSLNGGGTGWGEDFTKTSAATSSSLNGGGTGWGED